MAADALPLKTGVMKAPVAFPIRVPDVRKASSHKLFLLIFPAVEQVRHHIHDIRLYIVFRSQDGVADVLLLLDDPVELLVDRLSTKQVIAVHGVLLPNAVRPALGLVAIGVGPWQLDESHVAGGGQGDAGACRLDGANNDIRLRVLLEGVHRGLFLLHILPPGDTDRGGEHLQ